MRRGLRVLEVKDKNKGRQERNMTPWAGYRRLSKRYVLNHVWWDKLCGWTNYSSYM